MRCCTKQNKAIIQRSLQNSACMPIDISQEDSFYKDHDITCLNFIRSERSSVPTKFQYGEIKNKATGYLDLSLVYGNEDADTREVRTLSKGKLNVGAKNLLPTDSQGNYTKITDRCHAVPYTAILPALFTRQHNKMADELARLNPLWNDEKIFQETRRINIALFQTITYNGADFIFESKDGLKIDEKYDPTMDVSSNLEFHSAAYRYFHFYVNTDVMLVDRKNKVTRFSLSDIFGDLELVEDKFDSVVRGLLVQTMNFGEFSDEMTNRFAKNDDGLGIDVVSFDVQRGKVLIFLKMFYLNFCLNF
jgi:peroxidase